MSKASNIRSNLAGTLSMFSPNPTPEEIFRARVLEEPLVPIGPDPTPAENAALAAALLRYSERSVSDDFSSLTAFLESYSNSPWKPALLTNLGLEYYHAGHYSKTLQAWAQAWELGKAATDPRGKAIRDRAGGELAYMHARLGQKRELKVFLRSVEDHAFSGPATEKITGAREGLWNMENRPEIAFRCGPYALHRIKLSLHPANPGTELIHASESTQKGFSLSQVEELSEKLGLQFQMAYREKDATFVLPSVVHLKLDHFAAITRQEDNRYLLQDPTFGNDVWVTREALEAEASGYFLVPSGELPSGWRVVETYEGESVWGKGLVDAADPGPHGPSDPQTPEGSCPKHDNNSKGMAVPRVHLMLVSLNLTDEAVGYSPPVGPEVRFTVRYNQREAFQPAIFGYSNLGPKWTFDWLSYINGDPNTSDVHYYIMGGGTRTFTGFNAATKTFAFQQLDQTLLTLTEPDKYEMLSPDGSKKIFGKSDGSLNSRTRKIFVTEVIDPHGNAVSLNYDANLRLIEITDAVGQVTKIFYEHPTDSFKITKVMDPFGRFATFDYDEHGRLIKITDVIDLTSEFTYDVDGANDSKSDFILKLTTPYGVTTFAQAETLDRDNGLFRMLETTYPDGDRDRVEFKQSSLSSGPIPESDPWHTVPEGVTITNLFLETRNTVYWDKKAYANAYPDYTKAKVYHWLHGIAHVTDLSRAAGILESVKEPLEGRIWFDYAGQGNNSIIVGNTNKPAHVGRVLDDGSTQLYTYEYNGHGNMTKQVDPLGRTFSYIYAENGIDLLEIRQTRADQNELLAKMTYEDKHLLKESTDAAGQTTTYTYNDRGQVKTKTNAKNETITYIYDDKGHLTSIEGPLPGASITFTYHAVSRVQTRTDESGYTLTFDYDDLDRLTKITFPDRTFYQFTFKLLDLQLIRDRAGRQTIFEYNSIRQMTKRVEPLGRVTLYDWCKCGALRSLTDPMGRTTSWRHDIQGRIKCKEHADGSKVTYLCEDAISRVRQRIDEKLQVTQYSYNLDNTVSRISYANATVETASVAFTYDASHVRITSMTDGTGRTHFDYIPITPTATLGAGQLASVDGPLPNDTVTYAYDELGRRVSTAINGIASSDTYDAGGRITTSTNSLGAFTYTYDGNSFRRESQSHPSGQTVEFHYADTSEDLHLQMITNKLGIRPISEFIYGHDVPTGQITTWSQQSDEQPPSIYGFRYDDGDQLRSASLSKEGNVVKTFGYSYDSANNRLTEQIDATKRRFSYNSFNQLTSVEGDTILPATYQWDAEHRLISVISGNQKTEFTYDGLGRRVGIRFLVNGAEVADRRFLWCENDICEERTEEGAVVKRFFPQGMKVEAGSEVGNYFYTRDHLDSVREVIDDAGSIRARFDYDPYGTQVQVAGNLKPDFGFTGHFSDVPTALCLTKFRAYDPAIARWLSRDPLPNAEWLLGPNGYVYVNNNPVNDVDPDGLGSLTYNLCVEACKLGGGNSIICAARCLPELAKPDPPPPPPPRPPDPISPPRPEPPSRGPYRKTGIIIMIVCGVLIIIILGPAGVPVPA
jgi:RHS repeat-associated protein